MSERTAPPDPESAPPAEVEPPPAAYDPTPTYVPPPSPPPEYPDEPARAYESEPRRRTASTWTPPAPAYDPPPAQTAPGPPEVLTDATRRQLGLPELKVIFVAQGEDPSLASALINYQKVYINDIIPETTARVTRIDVRGVEIEYRGKRYFLRK
jgi:hypothetical protein